MQGLLRATVGAAAMFMATGSALGQQESIKPVQLAADGDRAARVAKLVSQMTLEEKVSQLQNHAAAIPRLGILEYDYWSEGLHGSARSGYSTMFPQAIGLAAMWDTEMLHEVARTISVEARAKHSEAVRRGNFSIFYGLTIWSPNINIFRDPRWGRGQETYGEDPFLTGRLGVAFVSGLQGDDTKYLRAVATPKHFAVHSGPESTRHTANVEPSAHDLQDTYLPAFRATVTEGHAQSVMCAYNSLMGEPACANTHLLGDLLRRAWKFDGFVTSDCAAVTDIAVGHKFAKDLKTASVEALRAGTDTSCGEEYSTLAAAVKDGSVKESELDVALQRLFMARFRLGLFDPAGEVPYEQLPFSEVDSAEHAELALKAAREAMVLLKNDGVLPLKGGVKTVAVIGPNAAALASLEGNYNATSSHPVTPLDGVRAALAGKAKVVYAQGSTFVEPLAVPVPETALSYGGKPGLHGEYFGEAGFGSKPVMTRQDEQVDFDWNAASPAAGVPANGFGVRWTGSLTAPTAGDYVLRIGLSDCYPCNEATGYALYLDGKLVGESKAKLKPSRANEGEPLPVHLADPKAHEFRLEYTHASALFGGGITLEWVPPAQALKDEAVRAAKKADVVVAFVGLSPNLEGEEKPVKVTGFAGGDRTDLKLPAVQQEMLEAVAATGKPMVVVLLNGSALAVNWAQEHAAAVLEAWYPGQAGGTAIGETLTGKNNPGGRLPVTFYKALEDLPSFDDYSMAKRTYRYSKATPLYGFGEGLSYTTFRYSGAALSSGSIAAGDPVTVRVKVANTGKMAGDEVVEVYLVPPASETAPVRELVGFRRVHLAAGESKDVAIAIAPRQLSSVDGAGRRAILPGSYEVYAASRQPSGTDAGLKLEITGTKELPE